MLEDTKNQVRAIPGKGGGSRLCDRMNSWAQGEGQLLGYIMWRSVEGAGPLAK